MKNHSYFFCEAAVISLALIFIVTAALTISGQITSESQGPREFHKPEWLRCSPEDRLHKTILYEYGAVYMSRAFASQTDQVPCIFKDQGEIDSFNHKIEVRANKFLFGDFYLEPGAKESLSKVFREMGGYQFVARNCNITTHCTNNINDDWALRTYEQTKCNWVHRGNNLDECRAKQLGKISIEDLDSVAMPRLFATAIPGASQHHLGLAVDVNNGTSSPRRICGDSCVKTLEENGWFRTVRYDSFHYTYLGYEEKKLPSKGLKKVRCSDTFTYWVPNVSSDVYSGFVNWRCKDVQ